MGKINSVEDIINFAIKNEEDAYTLYMSLSKKMDSPAMKKVFEDFALEEKSHKEKLLMILEGKEILLIQDKITDLKISDYMVDVNFTNEMDYSLALVFAMKAEKAAFKLYNELAEISPNEVIRSLFVGLAQEEAKHKLRFELEYEKSYIQDN